MINIYGQSDDYVLIDGNYHEQVDRYGTDDAEKGIFLVCSDGTIAEFKYGKEDMGIWGRRDGRRSNGRT